MCKARLENVGKRVERKSSSERHGGRRESSTESVMMMPSTRLDAAMGTQARDYLREDSTAESARISESVMRHSEMHFLAVTRA